MIKRLIFDVDNTLLMWRDRYDETYKYALDELNIKYNKKELDKLIDLVNHYEDYYDIFNKQYMVDLINNNTNIKVPNNFVDIWMKYLCNCYDKDDKKIEPLLKYLSNKYELVILSNWFSYSQNERLKNIGIDKYFKYKYYSDEFKNKPNKEAFIKAIGNYKPSECLMIGDNYKVDIEGAIKIGLKAILVDKDNKYNYKYKIKDINELEEIL